MIIGHKKIGEFLVKSKANIDATTNDYQQTPLHYAVKYGQIEFAEMLVEHGAKIDVADRNGYTALSLAVGEPIGHVKILELLSKNDEINKFRKDGKSLLHLSIEKGGDMRTFEWLVDKGADIHVTDDDGCSLIHSAAQHGRTDIVEWLIEHHPIDRIINKQDYNGNTPLHYSVKAGRTKHS